MKPFSNNLRCALLAAAALLAAGPWARADNVRTKAGIGYSGTVTDLTGEGIVIDVSGTKRSVPLSDVARIEVKDFPDLVKAEGLFASARDGEGDVPARFAAAERLYRAMLRSKAPPWLKTLVQLRLCEVYGEAGRISMALDAYLSVARTQPKLVANVSLPGPREGDKDNRAMLAQVEEALKAGAGKSYAESLETFRAALMLLEGSPEEVLPIIRQMRKSDDPAKRRWAALKELEILLATAKIDEAENLLAALDREWGGKSPGPMAFWNGRILEARKDHLPAAIEFMRVAILHATDDRLLAAEALWRAGQAMEAAKLPSAEVKAVYKEAVTSYQGTPGAERAKRELARLGSN